MLRNKKRNDGFTLVEIIVVLLIIGILLAITIPSIMGYVKKAKEAQYIADARSVYLTAERLSNEMFANEFNDPVSSSNKLKKMDSKKREEFINKIINEFKNVTNKPCDIIIYYDDVEPGEEYEKQNVAFSIKNDVKNHFISKIAIGFSLSEIGFPQDWVVIRTNEEAKYFTLSEIYALTGGDWYIQLS